MAGDLESVKEEASCSNMQEPEPGPSQAEQAATVCHDGPSSPDGVVVPSGPRKSIVAKLQEKMGTFR
ncbi:30S ribosomal protein S5 [Frankliniella fusca]|uniref:30S ribosomal protein S5 n=1 Tax=Frankliniella fusca TaxID=407009 RepID=A0AAE1LKP6_9NEOP|nr:30S ribosomal protein S5 [Frankliniella fusca]